MTTLFFDLDGTLMVNPFWRVVFPKVTQAIAAHNGQTTPEHVLAEIIEEHDQRLQNPLSDRPRTMDWDDIFGVVAARYGATIAYSAETLVIEHAAPPYTAVLDDAVDVLQRLKTGRRLVVASMGLAKFQVPVLKALGLYDLFDDFLMPDLTGWLKTERGFYRDYPEEAGLRLHIGDRYDHDCVAPMSFGSQSILRLPLPELADLSPFERPQILPRLGDKVAGYSGEWPCLPVAVITNLSELPEVVQSLELGNGR